MPWFAAHVVLRVNTQPPTDAVSVWENVYLLSAVDPAAAHAQALKRGARAAVGDFEWEGRPATWTVAGVRKVVSCDDEDDRPGDGTELTYSQLKLDDVDALRRFLANEPVAVVFED